MSGKYWQAVIIVVGLLGHACTKQDAKEEAAAGANEGGRPIPVQVKTMAPEVFSDYGEFLGELIGVEQAPLISYAGGRVLKVTGKEGERVEAGTKLCDIEGDSYEVQYASALLAARIARQTHERRKLAQKKGTSSQLQVDQAREQMLSAQSRAIDARKIRDGAFCISPIAGTVVERLIRPFQVLPQASSTFVVADLSKMVIRFGVPENEIQGYEVGSPATLTLSAYPGKTWHGKVSSLAQSVNEKGRTFLAEAEVDNENGLLRPGLTARLKVQRFKLKDQVVLPQSAILTSGKERFVYVVENEVAKKRLVKILTANKKKAVIEDGLKLGEQVIVGGHLLAGDGAKVRIIDETKPREAQSPQSEELAP